MYHGDYSGRKTNPKVESNIFSYLSFLYTIPVLKRGFRKDLEEDDVYEVIPSCESQKLGDKLERIYEDEKRTKKKISMLRLLVKCYWKEYCLLGLSLMAANLAATIIMPLSISNIVAYFNKNDKSPESRGDIIMSGMMMIVFSIFYCIFTENYHMKIAELSIKVRAAVSALIYRKSLKLDSDILSTISMGKIVTLISKDIHCLDSAFLFVNELLAGTVQVSFITALIYSRIGLATLAGIGCILCTVPIQLFLGRLTTNMRKNASKLTDQRLQQTQETLSIMKIIKMYTWERFFIEKISKKRKEEIREITKIYFTKTTSIVLGGFVSYLSHYLFVMTYIWMGNSLTADLMYLIKSCLHPLRLFTMFSIPIGISQIAELQAAFFRINKLLNGSELKRTNINNSQNLTNEKPLIEVRNASVKFNDKEILRNINLSVDSGFNLITGRNGCGKSSFLKTILKEYLICNGVVNVRGKISYASEEPWVFPSSIKQNIIFGEVFDKERYEKVLDVCQLQWDIGTFEKGDNTIIGDRGMNVSKGQQARINIARAVYRKADIYLFDDCLTSLDEKVRNLVFNQCIKAFLADKICFLVSNNPNHLKYASNIIIMESGTIKSYTKTSEISKDDINRIMESGVKDEHEMVIDDIEEVQIEETESLSEESKFIQNNIYEEKKKKGAVSLKVFKQYISFGGGLCIQIGIVILFVIAQGLLNYTDVMIANWSNVEQNISDYKVQNMTNTTDFKQLLEKEASLINKYTLFLLAAILFLFVRSIAHFMFTCRASIKLHKKMITSVINAKLTFFDRSFIGNIINRFSKDFGSVDEYLPYISYQNLLLFIMLIGVIVLLAMVNIAFLILTVGFISVLLIIRKWYIPTGRSLKRLEASTRSPFIGHLNATLEGLITIRAFNSQHIVSKEFDRHQNLYNSTQYMFQSTTHGFSFIMHFLGSLVVAMIVLKLLFYDSGTDAGNVGLVLVQALMLTEISQRAIRLWAELESAMTSVERTIEYCEVEQESESGVVVENWPKSGGIIYKNVKLCYEKSKEEVLKEINFTVHPGEKIGIVGRTGAGKSSIISTLFRLYNFDGVIEIDNVDISTLSLDFYRSKIAIIPQDPVLFSDTIRSNIDPLGRHEDEEIWNALNTVKMNEKLQSLSTVISSNFSSGEKQLICLARAIVSRNKIIVLDEATANMDPETNELVQRVIKESFSKCTVLTIAHKLDTVRDSQRVMVVDRGRIVEFDNPDVLLNNRNGYFYKMLKQAHML